MMIFVPKTLFLYRCQAASQPEAVLAFSDLRVSPVLAKVIL